MVRSGRVGVLTSGPGRASLALPAGPRLIRVSAIGFRPESLNVRVVKDSSLTVDVELHTSTEELEEIRVSATRGERRIEDEPERVEVLSGEDVAEKTQLRPADLVKLLTEMVGVRMQSIGGALGPTPPACSCGSSERHRRGWCPQELRRRPAAGSSLAPAWVLYVRRVSSVFGSGPAIVPFLHGGVVLQYHWLTERPFVDAVAVALITPGPMVITTGFIGYLVAGLPGAFVAADATFLPCFVFTVLPAYFHRYGKRPWLAAIVKGVTAAATGAIVGAVIVIGRQWLVDVVTVAIALGALGLTLLPRKVPEPLIAAAAALIGLLVRH